MSRIGKLPINIPQDVSINYEESKFTAKGKFGILTLKIPDIIEIMQDNNKLTIQLKKEVKKLRPLHGLYRTLIYNMILGVSKQFHITLVLKGVGYRASVQNEELILNLGYSHLIKVKIPKEIIVEIVQNTTINLKSCDKEKLGLFASMVRSWRLPEPYKGKGILYKDEQILRKAGKSGK